MIALAAPTQLPDGSAEGQQQDSREEHRPEHDFGSRVDACRAGT
jgi:hypothetical protein